MKSTLTDTLILFSIYRRLATQEELYRYQYKTNISRSDIHQAALAVPGVIYRDGFYGFESEFQELWEVRQEKDRETLRRYRKIQRYGKFLISMPFIRGVFVAGSLTFSSGNPSKSSDIDLFVVTADQYIWIARLGITLLTHILGIRRRGEYDENLFCLNHYITESQMYRSDHDMYSALLYSDYLPIGKDSQTMLARFWEVNSWRQEYYPQARPREHIVLSQIQSFREKRVIEWSLSISGLAWICNAFTKKIQQKKIQSNALTKVPHARIKATDEELEFHPYPNTYTLQKSFQTRKKTV